MLCVAFDRPFLYRAEVFGELMFFHLSCPPLVYLYSVYVCAGVCLSGQRFDFGL